MQTDTRSRPTAPYPWLAAYPAAVDWFAPIPTGSVGDLFDQAVARFGPRPCLDFLDKRCTYEELGAQVRRATKGLQALGIGKGSKVGLFLPNCPFFVIVYFAALKAGATVVNFNPLYPERDIVRQLEDSETELMVTLDLKLLHDKVAPHLGRFRFRHLVVCRMADALPFPKKLLFPLVKRAEIAPVTYDGRCTPFSALLDNDGKPAPVAIDPAEDVAVLQYTGGTTGIPKGAMLTHANLTANVHQSARWFHAARPGEEKVLGVLPFFHIFAMTIVLNMSLHIGAEIIILPRFEIEQVMAVIDRKKPTMLPAVPTIYGAIASHRRLERYDLSSVRACISGGAPLPLEIKRSFERLTGCTLFEGYGLTEAGPVVCCNPLQPELQKAGSIGLPYPGTVLEVVSLTDRTTVVPPGERGELCVRGPQVMKGYWKHPGETAEVLEDGRLHTGDVAVMDERGIFTLVDRIKDLILVNGFNVYPRHVEEAIYLHPDVEECVVAGLPDPRRGQVVKAYVKRRDGSPLTEDELRAFLRDKLSPMEMPRTLEFRGPLPRTMIGKLSRKALLEEEATRAVARAA